MDCIEYAFRIDKTGKATQLPVDILPKAPAKGQGFVWLHFDRKNPQTRQVLSDDEMVDNVATDTLLAEDSRPRTIIRNEDVLINLRGINLNSGAEPEDMIPIRFFVHRNRVISVCGRAMRATQDRVERLKSQKRKSGRIRRNDRGAKKRRGQISSLGTATQSYFIEALYCSPTRRLECSGLASLGMDIER